MPRTMSDEARRKISAAMKRRHRQGLYSAPVEAEATTNGVHVESRLILHVQGHELTLTPDEARTLTAALMQAGYAAPKESA